MWNSCITTPSIWVYNEKVLVFADISIPSKIIDLIRAVYEIAKIAFSGHQNAENEHCETLKKLVHKLNFHRLHSYTRRMWYSCITTLAIWVYNEKEVVLADISNPNTSISKIIDLISSDDEWAEIAFSGRKNTENVHFETQRN